MEPLSLHNVHVKSHRTLIPPGQFRKQLALSDRQCGIVAQGRKTICDILDGTDSRIFLVVGPCSIHDTKAALDYANKLQKLSQKVQDKILLVMRVYFEKPRTTVGWKGLINDPYLDDSFHIEEGLKIARKLLLDLTELGLPTATEALDPVIPQYISDLISWTAIGARTTESQTHREMASGLSTPVGFKNGTDGNIQVALNAMQSSTSEHNFLGIDSEGRISIYQTKGNPYSHIVLRGGGGRPNYFSDDIDKCIQALKAAKLCEKIMVDCSHGNSNKDYQKQPDVFRHVLEQILAGNHNIVGMMIESNLLAGNQKLTPDLSLLKYGVSVTDACIDWDTTENLILEAHKKLS